MYKIGCVIVTYNPNELLKKVVSSCLNQVDNLIIVDNGSNIKIEDILEDIYQEKINILYLKENKGIAKALNIGIDKCIDLKSEWILTLDQDSIVCEDMIEKMIKSYEIYENKDSIAMLVPEHIEESEFKNVKYNDELNKTQEVLTEITSGSLVKSLIYKKYRKYNEQLFIDLVDHEYCLYLNSIGLKILKVGAAKLKHNLGNSKKYKLLFKDITATNHDPIRRYYMSRNRMYVWEKYKLEFKQWVRKDKIKFINENIKILIFEDRKIEKFKMELKGIKEYRLEGKKKYDM